jgi:hypothetical protein
MRRSNHWACVNVAARGVRVKARWVQLGALSGRGSLTQRQTVQRGMAIRCASLGASSWGIEGFHMPQHHSWAPLRVPAYDGETPEQFEPRRDEILRIVNGFRMGRFGRSEAERLERRLAMLRSDQSKKPASSSRR